jgi:hypothetical protein
MRRSPLLAAIAVALAATPAVGATAARPALRLVDRTPVTVTGRGFDAQETVRVRLAAQGRTWTRRAVAGAMGTLRIRFTASLGRCASFSLQAYGSAGSRARFFATAPQPDCSSNE